MNKRLMIFGGSVLVLLAAALILLWPSDPIEKEFRNLRSRSGTEKQIPDDVSGLRFKDIGEGALVREGELTFEQMVAALRQRYGKHLNHAFGRRRLIEELMSYLRSKHPNNWVAMMRDLLGAAFPAEAEKLFRLSENMYKYNKYLEENAARLGRMTPEERLRALADVRDGMFGKEEAAELFKGELQALTVRTTLGQISAMKDKTVKEKLELYQDSLKKTYGDALPLVQKNRVTNVVNAFVDAVQADLETMKPEERTAALRDIRRGLGMDDSAVHRWDDLDRSRDDRWNKGQDYISRRKEMERNFTGSDRAEKLREMREQMFGRETAAEIAREESQGFNRFERKRRFGRE